MRHGTPSLNVAAIDFPTLVPFSAFVPAAAAV